MKSPFEDFCRAGALSIRLSGQGQSVMVTSTHESPPIYHGRSLRAGDRARPWRLQNRWPAQAQTRPHRHRGGGEPWPSRSTWAVKPRSTTSCNTTQMPELHHRVSVGVLSAQKTYSQRRLTPTRRSNEAISHLGAPVCNRHFGLIRFLSNSGKPSATRRSKI
jgi:hypothetical protein